MTPNNQITMTLNEIRNFTPCVTGWNKLLKSLNKTLPDNEPITLEFILDSNGIIDAIWCMRVNWFENKELYMKFVNNCVKRAKEYAAADTAATATDAAYVAAAATAYADAANAATDAANAAAYVAVYAAVYAAYAAAEREKQTQDLRTLLNA